MTLAISDHHLANLHCQTQFQCVFSTVIRNRHFNVYVQTRPCCPTVTSHELSHAKCKKKKKKCFCKKIPALSNQMGSEKQVDISLPAS